MKARLWPFPGDQPIVRARKMALAYRQAHRDAHSQLRAIADAWQKMDPRIIGWIDDDVRDELTKLMDIGAEETPEALDQRFYEWGEDWHAQVVRAYADDEMITAKEAAAILCITTGGVGNLRSRGRIQGTIVHTPGRTPIFYYKAADVYQLARERRARTSPTADTTDSIPTSGTGDAE